MVQWQIRSQETELVKALILGLGNPVLGDDAIGCRCAQDIKENLSVDPALEVDQFYRGGIALMERLIGYDRVLLIDSFVGSGKPTGESFFLTLNDLPSSTTSSPHDTTLKASIEFGKRAGEHLPECIDIIAVEIEQKFEFSEMLSPEIALTVPRVRELAAQWIRQTIKPLA
jgi:hydrogenase maturation protease